RRTTASGVWPGGTARACGIAMASTASAALKRCAGEWLHLMVGRCYLESSLPGEGTNALMTSPTPLATPTRSGVLLVEAGAELVAGPCAGGPATSFGSGQMPLLSSKARTSAAYCTLASS